MAFNGSGVFNRLFVWGTDKTNLVPVTASRMDSEMDGFATGLSTCITKDGQTAITAAIPWNSQNLTGVGVLTVTGSTASTNTTTGAAIITGGMGVGGAVNIGGALNVTGDTAANKFTATNQPCFSATKNNTTQTGIASVTFTKLTFTTEVFDIGGYYDASTSKWTPPAGMVHISAASGVIGATATFLMVLAIYKNGVRYKDGINTSASATEDAISVHIIDRANGTDYYEVFLYATGGALTADGGNTVTYFMGTVL